jgi:DnaJ-class molecular chaperone
LLELPPSFSAKQLKQAYLRRCQLLHPDHSVHDKATATELFVEMAAAFDLLKGCVEQFDARAATADARAAAGEGVDGKDDGADFYDEDGFLIRMTVVEEEAYRDSCMQWVHLSAELVEELKADPGFREWLKGKS